MVALIDTSFLLAVIFPNDTNHKVANKAIRSLKVEDCIIPIPVLPELFYMTSVRINYEAAIRYLEQVQKIAFAIQSLNPDDRQRMLEIMKQYASAKLDFTDVALMALSERLNITQVYTFDHRDFSIFRPKHCPYLELLP